MTKQEFLNGERFSLEAIVYGTSRTDYNFITRGGLNAIDRNYISSLTGEIILTDSEVNISEITKTGFKGFTFIMGKKVEVKFQFKNLLKL